jgi:alkylation response protein AidB-like acyl-CoA dehydrogenase
MDAAVSERRPFELTDEQRALRAAASGFFAEVSSEKAVRALLDDLLGHDPAVWDRAVSQLGLAGLCVSEALGGAGAGCTEAAIVLEEAGRTLYAGPLLSTMLAGALLTSCRGAEELLARLAGGAAFAVAWDGGYELAGSRVSGATRYVVDGASAEVLLLPTPQGLAVVDASAPGVTREALLGFDRTRRLATMSLRDAPATVLPGDLAAAHDVVAVLVAAEQLGTAQQAFDLAVGYAKERVQFGRAIGSFQAIKHLLADLLLEVESARSAVYYAAWAADEKLPELRSVAPLARAYCADVLLQVASQSMQVHGGISFTWEHPAHLYFRRAKAAQHLYGDPRSHRQRLARELGVEVTA